MDESIELRHVTSTKEYKFTPFIALKLKEPLRWLIKEALRSLAFSMEGAKRVGVSCALHQIGTVHCSLHNALFRSVRLGSGNYIAQTRWRRKHVLRCEHHSFKMVSVFAFLGESMFFCRRISSHHFFTGKISSSNRNCWRSGRWTSIYASPSPRVSKWVMQSFDSCVFKIQNLFFSYLTFDFHKKRKNHQYF